MKIRKKFLQLTKRTYPHGTEDLLKQHLPQGYKTDEFGNYYMEIGENVSTMFTCHLDTASREVQMINQIQTGNFIHTDGKSILGADDKAGMTVILYMISKKVPGLYYFFIGEEVGCIGSRALSNKFDFPNITKVVSFDRRGTNSVITEQMYGRCCSDEFAQALCNLFNSTGLGLNYSPDDTGIVTDSAQFIDIVPECTNISVGYYHEHTGKEKQDIDHLTKLCRAAVSIDWESLPIVRNPDEPVKENSLNLGMDDLEIDELDFDFNLNDDDDEWSESRITYITDDGFNRRVYISSTWIEKEKSEIERLLKSLECYYEEIFWDGENCYANEGRLEYIGSRLDLIAYLDGLRTIPYSHLRFEKDKEIEPEYFDKWAYCDNFWSNL
jgi:hypothetical protein